MVIDMEDLKSYIEDEENCPRCGNLNIEYDNEKRGCYCCGFSWHVNG